MRLETGRPGVDGGQSWARGGRWWLLLRRWGGCGREGEEVPGLTAGTVVWLACWGARCLATAREISGPPKCTHNPGHEAQNVPQGNMRGREGWVGSLGHTRIVRNVLNPWAATRCPLRVWSLDVVEAPVRSLTGLPTTRLPPQGGATGGSLALGSQRLSSTGQESFKNQTNRDAHSGRWALPHRLTSTGSPRQMQGIRWTHGERGRSDRTSPASKTGPAPDQISLTKKRQHREQAGSSQPASQTLRGTQHK